jgi:hypothetical protein
MWPLVAHCDDEDRPLLMPPTVRSARAAGLSRSPRSCLVESQRRSAAVTRRGAAGAPHHNPNASEFSACAALSRPASSSYRACRIRSVKTCDSTASGANARRWPCLVVQMIGAALSGLVDALAASSAVRNSRHVDARYFTAVGGTASPHTASVSAATDTDSPAGVPVSGTTAAANGRSDRSPCPRVPPAMDPVPARALSIVGPSTTFVGPESTAMHRRSPSRLARDQRRRR